ncbi:MAG: dipeptide epimerase [Candidatus Marinimicrobia bacterium]|nr:dipeptide epimerase [Candidatus Neomarinimicrobiota bacterium]
MKLSFTTYRIFLKHTFGISRSSNNWYDIVLIFLQDGEIIARGEAAPSLRYNESTEKILSILNRGIILPDDSSITIDDMLVCVYNQLDNIKSLQAAFSMAIWDWWSQKNNKPLFDLLGYKRKVLPHTSFTIAIGNINDIEKKIEEAKPYDILKVKLGTPNKDKEIIKEIRKYTDKMIRVDANEGWDYVTALDMCKWLSDQNVEFIEQPFPAEELEKSKKLTKLSPLDIYADENSMLSRDIEQIKSSFDGINIKLMKCGSIEEAIVMIKEAKKNGLKIMLGCMVETSIGITAASHLASEVDKIDLDGNLLIKNDPYSGVRIVNGRLVIPNLNGLGIKLKFKHDNLL